MKVRFAIEKPFKVGDKVFVTTSRKRFNPDSAVQEAVVEGFELTQVDGGQPDLMVKTNLQKRAIPVSRVFTSEEEAWNWVTLQMRYDGAREIGVIDDSDRVFAGFVEAKDPAQISLDLPEQTQSDELE